MSTYKKQSDTTNTYADHAMEYLDAGFSPLPVLSGKRAAEMTKWTRYCDNLPSQQNVEVWAENEPDAGISLAMGTKLKGFMGRHIVAVDIDQNEFVEPIHKLIFDDPVNDNAIEVTKYGSKGMNIFVQTVGFLKSQSFNNEHGTVVDILSKGKQCVVPPSEHYLGGNYEWRSQATLLDVDPAKLPVLTLEMVAKLKALIKPMSNASSRHPSPVNDNNQEHGSIIYIGDGKFSDVDLVYPGNVNSLVLAMTNAAAKWILANCPDDIEERLKAIDAVVESSRVAFEAADTGDVWNHGKQVNQVTQAYDGSVEFLCGTSAGDGTFGTWERARILEVTPDKLRRPLSIVNDVGHAAAWLPVETIREVELDPKSGKMIKLDSPVTEISNELVIVREDGRVYSDVRLPNSESMSEAGFEIEIKEKPISDSLWSGEGVNRFLRGEQTETADLFEQIVECVSTFIDFDHSMANQRNMCEMAACYVMTTYCLEGLNIVGYLWPNGERGAGKSHFLYTLSGMTFLGRVTLAGSSFASLRDLANNGACLAFDDCEEISNPKSGDPNKRDLLLAGNRRGAQITYKESDGKNGWVTRVVDAFAPRMFSAINKPDGVLGSRTITIPLVRSNDPKRSNADPLDKDLWPHNVNRLVDDLWAFGLTHLTKIRGWDKEVPVHTKLHGRQLEPWRGMIAVALSLQNDHGVEGVFDRLSELSIAYQEEREELEVDDPPRILVWALWQLLNGEDVKQLETEKVVEEMNNIADDVGIKIPGEDYRNSTSVGRLLGSLRFKKATKGRKKRCWKILKEDVERTAQTHAVSLPGSSATSAASGDLPPAEGGYVGTSALAAGAALGMEVVNLEDDFIDD
jgi:hypothetical protein